LKSREEFLNQAERRYLDYLRSIVTREPFFPLGLRFGKSALPGVYGLYQEWLKGFRDVVADLGLRVEWASVRSTRFGEHEKPERVWFDDEVRYLEAIRKTDEARYFRQEVELIRTTYPSLIEWGKRNVRRILDHQGRWERLLRVVRWLGENPRSNLYTRALPIEGVDSKFIEQNKNLLDELVLSTYPQHVDTKSPSFESRHGLRQVEPLIRIRFLDPHLQAEFGFPVEDLALPLKAFHCLSLRSVKVVITENLRNFLVLPSLPETVAVFGGGNAVALLDGVDSLRNVSIFYWGDIDAEGFLMLNRVREMFPQTISLLMDMATFSSCNEWVGVGNPTSFSCPPRLTTAEIELFDRVVADRLRLEQERIPFSLVLKTLHEVIG